MSYSSLPSGVIGGGIDPLVGSPDNPVLRPQVPPLQAITKPQPIEYVEMKYYLCTVANASFHRFDGTRVGFRFGFLETNIKATQEYLDYEIRNGNPYLREATTDEVMEAKMRLDPVGTIREKVRDELELELRVKLEAEIREKMGLLRDLNTPAAQTEVNRSNGDAEKLSGMDVRQRLADTTDVKIGEGARVVLNPVSTANIKGAMKG